MSFAIPAGRSQRGAVKDPGSGGLIIQLPGGPETSLARVIATTVRSFPQLSNPEEAGPPRRGPGAGFLDGNRIVGAAILMIPLDSWLRSLATSAQTAAAASGSYPRRRPKANSQLTKEVNRRDCRFERTIASEARIRSRRALACHTAGGESGFMLACFACTAAGSGPIGVSDCPRPLHRASQAASGLPSDGCRPAGR